MARALRKKFPRIVSADTERRVRFAALLHDTGHSAFSHTTEEIYKYCGDLRNEISEGGEFSGKGAGEVLSYLIATSKAFRKFFSKLQDRYPKELTFGVDDFAPLILSRPANDKKRFEADIISGPFDADKLDYFPRDSRAAGVRLSIDIDRLLHCIGLAEYKSAKKTRTWIMVVSRGGFNPIQQLLFARATLFSSVYHHHKVRACDCMIKAGFEIFRDTRRPFIKRVDKLSMKSAGDFLFLTDSDYFAQRAFLRPQSKHYELIHGLLYRRLFKRILTISTHTIEGFSESEEVKSAYRQFYNLRNNPEATREFARMVLKESGVRYSPYEVWLDVPKQATLEKAGLARINVAPRGAPAELKRLAEFIPVKDWTETYGQYYAQSFLFGPPQIAARKRLAKAAVKLFASEFGLEFKSAAYAEDIR
jgi:hypothetical protein